MKDSQKKISLSEKQDLAWHYLEDDKTTEILYGGAAGGGKSFLACLWHIYRRTTYSGTRGLIGRYNISDIEQSTLITLFKVADLLGYVNGVHFKYNAQKHIINWANGSVTILKELMYKPSDPDYNSLGSTEYTDAIIEEGHEVKSRGVEIVSSRLRWKINEFGLTPKTLITCNPGPGWIKDKYIKDPLTMQQIELKEYQKYIFASLPDNPDLDFRKDYEMQLSRMSSTYDKERLLFGNWDVDRDVSNPFAHQYDKRYHEDVTIEFNPNKQLYISLDFNLNPFAVTFWQYWNDSNGFHWHGIGESEIAHGNIPDMIYLIKSLHWQSLHTCILTGDAMGNKREIALKDNASHYMTIQRGLGLGSHQIQVPSNPTHQNSRSDVNNLLWLSKQPDSKFYFKINPKLMPNTAYDFGNVQCDAFGEIIKSNRKNLNQRADYLDTGRYFINLTAKPILLKYSKPMNIHKGELKTPL